MDKMRLNHIGRILNCIFVSIFILLLESEFVSAQVYNHSSDIVVEHFTVQNGLPTNNLTKFSDSLNYPITFGSTNGAIRFDGKHFEVFQTSEIEYKFSNSIRQIHHSVDGSIWVVDNSLNAVQIQKNKKEFMSSTKEIPSAVVYELKSSSSGKVWLATSFGIVNYHENEGFQLFNSDFKFDCNALHVVNDNLVYAMTKNGFYVLSNNRIQKLVEDSNLLFQSSKDVFITQTSSNEILIAANKGFIHFDSQNNVKQRLILNEKVYYFTKYEEKIFLVHTESTQYLYNSVTTELIDIQLLPERFGSSYFISSNTWNEKTLWVGKHSIIWDSKEIFKLNESSRINQAVVDKENHLWVLSSNQGLFRIDKNLFNTYGQSNKGAQINAYSILNLSENIKMISTFGEGFFEIDTKSNKILNNTNLSRNMRALTIYDDKLVFGTWGDGLWVKSEDKWNKKFEYVPKFNLQGNFIDAFYEDKSNRLWIGSYQGLFYTNSDFSQLVEVKDSLNFPIRGTTNIIEKDSTELLLLTFGNGVFRFNIKDYSIRPFTTQTIGNYVRDCYIQSKDTLWFASTDLGLVRYTSNKNTVSAKRLTKTSLPIELGLHRILKDEFDFFWISSNQGLFRVKLHQLNKYLDGKLENIRIQRFTEQNGLPHRELNGGLQNAGIIDESGLIWLPTQSGVVTFNPIDFITLDNHIEHIEFDKVANDKETYYVNSKADTIQVARNTESLSLFFNFVSYANTEKQLSYSFNNNTWIDLESGTRSIHLSTVKTGLQPVYLKVNGSENVHDMIFLEKPMYWYKSMWFNIIWISALITIIFISGVQFEKKKYNKSLPIESDEDNNEEILFDQQKVIQTKSESKLSMIMDKNTRLQKLQEIILNHQKKQAETKTNFEHSLLILEDEEEYWAYLYQLLNESYNLEWARTGKEALSKLSKFKPDLILSDVMMPEMDGIDFAKKMILKTEKSTTPIIFLSAADQEQIVIKGLELGATAFLPKNVSAKVLKAHIQTTINRQDKADELVVNKDVSEFKKKVDEIIQRNLGNPDLSVDTIASKLHMSRSTLYRSWKNEKHINLVQYINQKRLEETLQLVEKQGFTFSEASQVSGFSSPAYFSRIFKKEYGLSPSQYLKNKKTKYS